MYVLMCIYFINRRAISIIRDYIGPSYIKVQKELNLSVVLSVTKSCNLHYNKFLLKASKLRDQFEKLPFSIAMKILL